MLYYFCRFFIVIFMKLFFRLEVIGSENIPTNGSFILCSNHLSNFDPVALSAAFKRRLYFLAKKELFGNNLLGWLLRQTQMIPVDRSKTDMNAFREAVKILKNDKVLGIFAEGTRNKDGNIGDAKAGVALFAIKGKSNVLPVFISGNYKLFSKVTVKIGKVIDMSEYAGVKANTQILDEITDKIMHEVKILK